MSEACYNCNAELTPDFIPMVVAKDDENGQWLDWDFDFCERTDGEDYEQFEMEVCPKCWAAQ